MNLIFCVHPRCGSTVLCLALQQSCKIDVCHEPLSISEIKEYHSIAKVVSSLNYDTINKKFIDASKNILLLYRNNILDAILSEHMSSTFKTENGIEIWNTVCNESISEKDKEDFYKTARPPINFSKAKIKIKEADNRFTYYTEYIHKKNKNLKTISYETLYCEQNSFNDICEFFGYSIKNNYYKELMSHKNKINNNETYRKLIPNYKLFKEEFYSIA